LTRSAAAVNNAAGWGPGAYTRPYTLPTHLSRQERAAPPAALPL